MGYCSGGGAQQPLSNASDDHAGPLDANLSHGFYLVVAQAPAPVTSQMLLEGHVLCGYGQVAVSIPTRAVVPSNQRP